MCNKIYDILYVEDEPIQRAFFDILVRYEKTEHKVDFNANVVFADSVPDAKSFIESAHYDVVITDYHLHAQFGTELAEWIRTCYKTRKEKRPMIILHSAVFFNAEQIDTQHIDAILQKPLSLPRLKEEILKYEAAND